MRPVNRAGHMTVLHRIDMHIIHMRRKVLVVADGVFPIAIF